MNGVCMGKIHCVGCHRSCFKGPVRFKARAKCFPDLRARFFLCACSRPITRRVLLFVRASSCVRAGAPCELALVCRGRYWRAARSTEACGSAGTSPGTPRAVATQSHSVGTSPERPSASPSCPIRLERHLPKGQSAPRRAAPSLARRNQAALPFRCGLSCQQVLAFQSQIFTSSLRAYRTVSTFGAKREADFWLLVPR